MGTESFGKESESELQKNLEADKELIDRCLNGALSNTDEAIREAYFETIDELKYDPDDKSFSVTEIDSQNIRGEPLSDEQKVFLKQYTHRLENRKLQSESGDTSANLEPEQKPEFEPEFEPESSSTPKSTPKKEFFGIWGRYREFLRHSGEKIIEENSKKTKKELEKDRKAEGLYGGFQKVGKWTWGEAQKIPGGVWDIGVLGLTGALLLGVAGVVSLPLLIIDYAEKQIGKK
ncbi:MAG: hypothetical protein AAB371_01055 [Patescibacteria group bacterium]